MAFKKLTAGLMASSMILGLAASASAGITAATPFEVASKMNKLGVVIGVGTNPDGSIDFNLGGNLTRAELVTTIVRSFGAEQSAQLAKGAPSFGDVSADAWYSGYVAVAKNLAEQAHTAIGRDATHFDPNANVSKAEALVFVMKFLGINVVSSGANWYEAWIAKAVELGMISQADASIALANPGAASTRGEAFIILDFGYSAKVLEGGKSIYTTYVDSVLPVVEVAAPAESTTEAKLTISGKASDNKAVASVAVNGTLVVVKDGNFSAEVALNVGANTIVVTAIDAAGNNASKTFTVTRVNATATSIEAADITVAAGGTATVTATVKDANGEVVSGVTVEGTSTVGTFAAGTFTAGTKAGAGTLTLKYGELTKEIKVTVTAGALAKVEATTTAAPGAKVTLQATDAYGNVVTGATFSQTSADALLDSNTGVFIASKAGTYDVSATKDTVTVTGKVGVYGALAKYNVVAPTNIVANGSTAFDVKVEAMDKNGVVISSFGETTTTYGETVTLSGPSGISFGDSGDTVSFNKGVATFNVIAADDLADSVVTLTADTNNDAWTTTGSTDVTVLAQVATGVKITSSPEFIAVNSNLGTPVKVVVVDQLGKTMKSGFYDLAITLTGAAALDSAGTQADTLTWAYVPADPFTFDIFPLNAASTGDAKITVSAEGLGTATASVKAAMPLAAANIKLVEPTTKTITADNDSVVSNPKDALAYTVQLTDANGVPVTTDAQVKLVFSGVVDKPNTWVSTNGTSWEQISTGTAAAFSDWTITGGTGTFYVQGETADTFTVQVKEFSDGALVGGYAEQGLKSSVVSSMDVVANTVETFTFDTSETLNVLHGAPSKATLKASVADVYGNPVKKAGVKVTFTTAAGNTLNGTDKTVDVLTDADGVATVEFAMPASRVTALVTAAALSGKTNDLAMSPGGYVAVEINAAYLLPAKLTASVVQGAIVPSSIPAGAPFSYVLTVKDNEGNLFAGLNTDDVVFTLNGDDVTGSFTFVGSPADAANGKYVFDVVSGTVTKLGANEIVASIANMADDVKVSKTVNIKAAAPAAFKVAEATWTDSNVDGTLDVGSDAFALTIKKNIRTVYTLQMTDTYGNVVVADKAYTFDLTGAAGSSYVQFTNDIGATITKLTISQGKTSNKFFLMTGADGSINVADALGAGGPGGLGNATISVDAQ